MLTPLHHQLIDDANNAVRALADALGAKLDPLRRQIVDDAEAAIQSLSDALDCPVGGVLRSLQSLPGALERPWSQAVADQIVGHLTLRLRCSESETINLEYQLAGANLRIKQQLDTIISLQKTIEGHNSGTTEGRMTKAEAKAEFAAEIADAEAQREWRDAEILDLRRKLNDANSRIDTRDTEIMANRRMLRLHEQTIADLNDKLKLSASKTNVANEATVFGLKNTVLKRDEQIARQADTIRELESRLAATKDSSYRAATDIRITLTHRENEIYKWKQKSTQATNLAEERECALEAAKLTLADLNVQLTQAKRDFESAKLTNADLNVRLSHTDSCCTVMNSRIGELQDTVQRRDEEIYELKEKFTAAANGEEKCRRDAEAAKLTIADLNAQLAQANFRDIEQAEAGKAHQTAAADYNSEISGLEALLTAATDQLAMARRDANASSHKLATALGILTSMSELLGIPATSDMLDADLYIDAIKGLQAASSSATSSPIRDLRPYTVIGHFANGERYIGHFTAKHPMDAITYASRSTFAPLLTVTVLDGNVEVAF